MTEHKIICGDSKHIPEIADKSIQLIVTSPPYPMIEMWDDMFCSQDPNIASFLKKGDGINAFYRMHELLSKTWEECDRILADNGFICINIGDATRSINNNFQLFSNHMAIINYFLQKGYIILPDIHWRKPSNAPNKFMGSGMYPAGAYVTYEHEYILVFRKGHKRKFSGEKKELRQKSAFFWEERNEWFSDLWEINGASQVIKNNKQGRERSAAFPFEVPFRLVNMYSIEGDTVVDPFSGLGTTSLACMVSQRNSIGVEIESEIANIAKQNLGISPSVLNKIIEARLNKHMDFIDSLPLEKQTRCYQNGPHGFKVKTKQETAIKIDTISEITITKDGGAMCQYGSPDGLLPFT